MTTLQSDSTAQNAAAQTATEQAQPSTGKDSKPAGGAEEGDDEEGKGEGEDEDDETDALGKG